MGFGEYTSDALFFNEFAQDFEEEIDEEEEYVPPDQWISDNQEDLLDIWMSLRDYQSRTSLLKYATFNSFCHWAKQNSV
jgi:hypothetical protein